MKTAPRVTLPSGKTLGQGQPCFIIAEIGNNHQGSLDIARMMVQEAARVGVDAVKFQKRDNASLFTAKGLAAPYTGANSFGATYGEHREALELTFDELEELKRLAESLGLVFFASAWDMPSLEGLAAMGVELFKVASADLVNIPMLRRLKDFHRPVILSTGMSTLDEIDTAITQLAGGSGQTILMHCNSSYPCPPAETCIPAIQALRSKYALPIGYSGHESGLAPTLAAVTLGACVVERHFTLDRNQRGTDHAASLPPDEFRTLVSMIRETEAALIGREKHVFPAEIACARKLRKSIVTRRPLTAGTMLTESDIEARCPGTGISPIYWDSVIGHVLTSDVGAQECLTWELLAPVSQPIAAD